MRKIKPFITLWLAIVLFSLSSCEDEQLVVIEGTMSVSIDGVEWTSIKRASAIDNHFDQVFVAGTTDEVENIPSDFSLGEAIVITTNGTSERIYNHLLTTSIDELKQECQIVYRKNASAGPGDDGYFRSTEAIVSIKKVDAKVSKISGSFSGKLQGYEEGELVEITLTAGEFTNVLYNQ